MVVITSHEKQFRLVKNRCKVTGLETSMLVNRNTSWDLINHLSTSSHPVSAAQPNAIGNAVSGTVLVYLRKAPVEVAYAGNYKGTMGRV